MNRIYMPALLLVLFSSCMNNTSDPKQEKAQPAPAPRILNNIELQTKELTVSSAYLINGADETLVPPTNKVAVGQPVKLRLLITRGWKEQKGTVSIGASETITTFDGQVLLHTDDVFKDVKQLDANDAHIITLTATITTMKKETDYFVVSFRIWDKNGPAQIQGRYRLYVS